MVAQRGQCLDKRVVPVPAGRDDSGLEAEPVDQMLDPVAEIRPGLAGLFRQQGGPVGRSPAVKPAGDPDGPWLLQQSRQTQTDACQPPSDRVNGFLQVIRRRFRVMINDNYHCSNARGNVRFQVTSGKRTWSS